MVRCENCIHEKVCLHRANIQTDTYAYMGVKYDTKECKHYMSADVVPKGEIERIFAEVDEAIDNLRGAFLRQRISEIKREHGVSIK